MDYLDKTLMREANNVTPDEYKRITGTSLEESMARMKEHMKDVKARVAAAKKAKAKKASNRHVNITPMDMRYARPMAASAQKEEDGDSSEQE